MDRLTREQAAVRSGISTRALDRRIRTGEFEDQREGRHVFVVLDGVEKPGESTYMSKETSPDGDDLRSENARLREQLRLSVERLGLALLTIQEQSQQIGRLALAAPALAPPDRPWWRFWS